MGIRYVLKQVEQKEAEEIICDMCEQTCQDFEYATFSASWGYYSGLDGEQWKYFLCEKCATSIYFQLKLK